MENFEEIKFGSDKWIDGFYDPTTFIQTISQCMVLADIYKDDDFKLILVDYGDLFSSNVEHASGDAKINNNNNNNNNTRVKLKVFKGLAMISEVSISDIPSSITTINVDTLVPNIPALAISCNSFVYIYKNLKPYFKFTLPSIPVCEEEKKAWMDFKNEHIKISELVVALDNIRGFGRMNELTQKSIKFLELSNNEDRMNFIETYNDIPLTKNTTITIMTSLMKSSHDDDDGIRCVVIGCEDGMVHIINPETFSVAASHTLPSIPVFMISQGLFDVEYSIYIACRNGAVYGVKRDMDKPKEFFRVTCHIVGLIKLGKSLVVGCMDGLVHCFNTKGTCLWSTDCHGDIQCIQPMELKMKNMQLLLVSVKPSSSSSQPPSSSSCGQIQIYQDKTLVDVIIMDDVIRAMKFGRYGRELDTLIMITRSGGLVVKVLKRTAHFDGKGVSKLTDGYGKGQEHKLEIPKRTKLFLDQAARERSCAAAMHQKFQNDLCRLKVRTSQSYLEMLDKQLNVVSLVQGYPVKLNVEVTGLGPTFKVNISVQNTSLNKSCHHYFITFIYDPSFYAIKDNVIFLPMIGPGLLYKTSTFACCVTDKLLADVIKVILCTDNNINPILTAVVSMPLSEGNLNF